jgi:hypothetical protein
VAQQSGSSQPAGANWRTRRLPAPRAALTPISVVAEQWLDSDATKKTSSRSRDRSIFDNHIIPLIGATSVGAVTRADVQKVVNTWTGACSVECGADVLGPASHVQLRRKRTT